MQLIVEGTERKERERVPRAECTLKMRGMQLAERLGCVIE